MTFKMQYIYLVTLCESLKLPRVQSFHQLLYPLMVALAIVIMVFVAVVIMADLAIVIVVFKVMAIVTMRIMVFKGIFTIVIMVSMVINITMIKDPMVIMVMLFVTTMSE